MEESLIQHSEQKPARPTGGFPTPGNLLVMLLLCIGAQFLTGILFSFLGEFLPSDADTFLSYTIAMALSVFAVLFYRSSRGAEGRWANFSTRGFDPLLVLHGFLTIVALSIVLEPLTELLPEVPMPIDASFWGVMTAVVAAPLCEEILCRGIVLGSAVKSRGVVWAWVFSSLFFGVIHFHPAAVIYASLSGLVLGYLALRSGSLLSSVLLHAANNTLSFILLAAGLESTPLSELISSPALYGILYFAMLALLVWEARKIAVWIRETPIRHKKGIEA